MADLTTRLELYLPGGGLSGNILPDEAVDIDKINDNMKKIDAAVGAKSVTSTTRPASPYENQLIYETDTRNTMIRIGASWVPVGVPNAISDAARLALYPVPVTGAKVFRTDKHYFQEYVGAAWRAAGSGLVPILPASVAGTGVTVDASGVVSFVASASVLLNGCFTPDFNNYRILIEVDTRSAAAGLVARMRAAGVDSIASHSTQFTYSNGTTAAQSFSALATANWNLDIGNQGQGDFDIDLRRPAVAVTTHGTFHASNIGGSIYDIIGSIFHNIATAYDGISFIPSTGTITGRLRIYGYN